MKTIAALELKPGMVLANDIKNVKGDIIIPQKSIVNDVIIAKLYRYQVMAVDIFEEEDLASTHFEKVRLSKVFKDFERHYNVYMIIYKRMINELISQKKSIDKDALMKIYKDITTVVPSGETLLDYLYNMLPSKDDLTYAHCLNSALIAGIFGNWLNLPEEEITTLIYTGFVYDVGKLLLPQDVLWKPSKLTNEEFALIKTHTGKGYNVIKDQFDMDIVKATLQHHERCDGTGYPQGFTSENISKYAKLISIVDAYEAMTSARTYRESLTPLQVVANFEDTARFYEKAYLQPILTKIANTQLGMTVMLNDNSIGEVIKINPNCLSKPLLKDGDKEIDMSLDPRLKVIAVL